MDIIGILLVLLLSSQLFTNAQSVTLTTLNLDKLLATEREGVIGEDETGIYKQIRIAKGASFYALTKSNALGDVIVYKELVPIDGMGKNRFGPQVFLSDGKLWMTVKHYNLKKLKITLLAQEIDINTFEYKGELKTLTTGVLFKGDMPMVSDITKPEGCAYFILFTGGAKGINCRLYNSNFEAVRDSGFINVPFESNASGNPFNIIGESTETNVWNAHGNGGSWLASTDKMLTGIICDRDGNLFMNIFFTNTKRNRTEGHTGNYIFILLKNIINATEIKIDKDDKVSLTSIIISKDELICAGFYSSGGEILPQGTRYLRLKTINGENIADKSDAYKSEVLDPVSYLPYENIVFGNKPEHTYYMHPCIAGEGTDVYLMFEHVTTKTFPTDAQGKSIHPPERDKREVIAAHLSADGNILWQHQIPRDFGLSDHKSRYLEGSFKAVVRNSTFYAFYIDAPENINVPFSRNMKRVRPFEDRLIVLKDPSKRALVVSSVSVDGHLERKNLQEFTTGETAFPGYTSIDKQGNVVMPLIDNPKPNIDANVYSKVIVLHF